MPSTGCVGSKAKEEAERSLAAHVPIHVCSREQACKGRLQGAGNGAGMALCRSLKA